MVQTRSMNSILQDKKYCFICGSPKNLHDHHIMNGPLRKKSEEDGLKVWLCAYCHIRVHEHNEQAEFLKKIAERKYLEKHSFDEYMKRYKRNYLNEEEIINATMNEIERGKHAN